MNKRKVMYLAAVFLIVFGVAGYSIAHNRQLGLMGGMAEEYIDMGWTLYQDRQFLPDPTAPAVFRPPVYPLFIAGILELWGGDRYRHLDREEERQQAAEASSLFIFKVQAALLAAASCLLFLILAPRIPLVIAFVVSLLFGCNVYLLILTGFLHYEILHIFCTLLSLHVLCQAVHRDRVSAPLMVCSGLLWGITTLLRPMTLMLPGFLFMMLLFLFPGHWRSAIRNTALLTLGMLVVILPWTVRNYSLTGRIIPVNAQGGIAVWASTVVPLERAPNEYRWWKVWYGYGDRIYTQVTGDRDYEVIPYIRNIIRLEDAFKREKWQNLKKQPSVYLRNAATNAFTFAVDINSAMVRFFQAIQAGIPFQKEWLAGDHQDFYPSGVAAFFSVFISLLSLLALAGAITGLRSREPSITAAFFVFLCFWGAHAVSYMDFLYYYIKVPFLFVFAGYYLHQTEKYRLVLFRKEMTPLPLIGILLSSGTLYLAVRVL